MFWVSKCIEFSFALTQLQYFSAFLGRYPGCWRLVKRGQDSEKSHPFFPKSFMPICTSSVCKGWCQWPLWAQRERQVRTKSIQPASFLSSQNRLWQTRIQFLDKITTLKTNILIWKCCNPRSLAPHYWHCQETHGWEKKTCWWQQDIAWNLPFGHFLVAHKNFKQKRIHHI